MVLVAPHALSIALEDLAAGEAAPGNAGYSFDWDHLHKYKNATSAAVDHYWILTAAHVADDGGNGSLTVGGQTYTQQQVVFHPFADLALVKYDKPFPGYYPLADSIPVGGEVVFCGFGRTGDVMSTRFSAYFTDSGSGNGTKRWGTNRIDNDFTMTYDAGAPLGITTNHGFEVTISKTPFLGSGDGTDYEAGGNVFDSGAGLFHYDGAQWELVGTMVTRTNNGVNFTGNFAVGTAPHVAWIKSVIVDYDTDMNGLPDWWEELYSVSDPSDDPDLDGFTNYEEWVADTNPNQGSSYLRALEFTNGVTFAFASSSNRVYQVERKDVLTNTVWFAATGWFAGDHPETATNLPAATPNRFYRVRAKLH